MSGLLKSLDLPAQAVMLSGLRIGGLVASCPCCGRTHSLADRHVVGGRVYLICSKLTCQHPTEITGVYPGKARE